MPTSTSVGRVAGGITTGTEPGSVLGGRFGTCLAVGVVGTGGSTLVLDSTPTLETSGST